MQRGLGNPRAMGGGARKDTVAAISKKFSHMQTSFQREGVADTLRATDGDKREGVIKLVQRRIEDIMGLMKTAPAADQPNLQAQLNAWNLWKVQFEADVLKTPNNDATKDFFAWLLGKGKEEHHRRTPWYRDQALVELDDVRAWIDGFADVFTESATELKKLAWKTPQNLDEAWLYFKFIVQTDWMKREDRFFWVDLVNLMEEKAKLGGGLTKEELNKTRPYVQEVQADGKLAPVPLTQEDAFGPNTEGVEGLFDTQTKDELLREGVLITLGKQLRQLAGIHDARAGSRHHVELSPLKRSELERQMTVARMSDEEARTMAANTVSEAMKAIGAISGDLTWGQTLAKGAKSGIVAWLLMSPDEPEPVLKGEDAELAEQLKSQLAQITELNQETLFQTFGGIPAEEETGGAYATTVKPQLKLLENTIGKLEQFVNIKSLEDTLAIQLRSYLNNLKQLRDVTRLRLDVLDARAAGVPTGDIPKYQAMMASLQTPDLAEIRKQTNQLVSNAVRASDKLAGKTMSTQDIGELQNNAYVARVLDLFIGARRRLLENFSVKIGHEAEFVNAALAERWKVWIAASDIKGALAERFAEAPNDPIKMASYYKMIMDGVSEKSEFLYKFLRSDEGRYLRSVFGNVLPPQQTDSIKAFEDTMGLHGHKLSEYARSSMEPIDYLLASSLSKSFESLDKLISGSLGNKVMEWSKLTFKGVFNFAWRAGKRFVISYGSSALAALSFAGTGSAAAGVGVGLLFSLIGKFLLEGLSIRSMMTKSFVMGQFVNGLAMFVGLPGQAENFRLWSFEVLENIERVLNFQATIPGATATASAWTNWLVANEGIANTVLGFGMAAVIGATFSPALIGAGVATPFVATGAAIVGGVGSYTAAQTYGRSIYKMAGSLAAALFYGSGSAPVMNAVKKAYLETDPRWLSERGKVLYNAAFGRTTPPDSVILNTIGTTAGWYPTDERVLEQGGFFLRSFMALASSEIIMDIGQLAFTTNKMAAVGFGPVTDLLNEKIDSRAKAAMAVYHMLWGMPGVINDLKASKMEAIEDIRAMKDVTLQKIRMDFLDQQQQIAIQRRFADMQSRRRLKEPKQKKQFLQKTREATDKRTGEGLVKKVGNSRVQVQ